MTSGTMDQSGTGKGYTIVMVDDDEDDIFIMRKELRKIGIGDEHFRAVSGGPELFSLLKEVETDSQALGPDLILLDINMPRMDGFEVLASLKSDEAISKIPVIMFSTSSQSADVAKSFNLGAEDYIVKPREMGEFQETVSRIRAFLANRNGQVGDQGRQH